MTQTSNRRSRKEGDGNMKVVVRVRPPNSVEVSKQSSIAVRVMDERVLVFDPKEDSMDYFQGDQRRRRSQFLTRRAKDLRFMFDRVFDSSASNKNVFEDTTKAIIDGVLGGYNCSVFAYGATGAGKTFTMLGDSTNPGVMFLTMMDLYSKINASKDEKSSDVAVSYLEVYNETIRDLLMPGQPLAVREDPQRGVCVSGLTLHKPASAEELLGMLEYGNNNRTQHPTDANAQSSRSHAVFQVFLRQRDRTASLKANITMGKMSLIDLAGSERAIVTSNSGARFREGANINKSLLALGNCINALADKENKSGHIPYRDSKLTRLLKDSLGGNCRTVMIAAVSPSFLSYEDTYNTLKYADRAMNIRCKVVKNEMSVDMHVSRYAKIVEELRLEISNLKDRLFGYESVGPAVTTMKSAEPSKQSVEEIQKFRSSLQCVMKERMFIRRNVIDIEAAERDLQVKLYRKERTLKRMQMVCVEGERLDQAASKLQLSTDATKSKQKYLDSKKADFHGQIAKNDSWLKRIHSEIALESDEDSKSQLEQSQSEFQLQMDNMELKRNCQLYKKHVSAQEKDVQNTERLLVKLLSMVQRQFFLLKGVGLATQDLTEEYNSVIDTVEAGREVTWADQSQEGNDGGDVSLIQSLQFSCVGTSQVRTPIRKRQFNTPDFDITTPCQPGASVSRDPTRTFSLSTTNASNCRPSRHIIEISDLANTRISLSKEFETVSPAAKTGQLTGETSTGVGQKLSTTSIVTTGVQPSRNNATPLRVPLSSRILMSPATFQTPIRLSESLKCTVKKGTPHPGIICWTEKPEEETKSMTCSATPLRESNNLNVSGILPLRQTPADKERHNVMPAVQVKSALVNNPLSTPLRELPVNKKTGMKDQLPSILTQFTKFSPFSKDKPNLQKTSKDMMPKRVCSAAKENAQLPKNPLRSSSSVLELDKLQSKKIKKHISGLRRAVSSTNIGTSRNFAPRSSPKRSFPARPRWQ